VADNQIITELLLDLDKFRAALTEAKGLAERGAGDAGDAAGKSLVKQFEDFKAPFVAAAAGFAAAAGVVMGAVKLTNIAEEAKRVDEQFRFLSQRAGVVGEDLKSAFAGSAAGLVDDTDLLKLANEAMVEIGGNVRRLPELMTLARKATAVFGGDLVSNFEAIKQAVVSGNERQIKHLGLTVDLQKAYSDYARSIGVTTQDLTEHQKQQIALNLILDKGKEAFRGVNASIGETSDAFQRFKVATNDFIEEAAKTFKAAFGPVILWTTNQLTAIMQQLKNVVSGNVFGGTAAPDAGGETPEARAARELAAQKAGNAAKEAEEARHNAAVRTLQLANQQAGAAINKLITGALSESMQQIGFALAGGEGAFKSFHRFLLDLLGNTAIAIGTLMVETGLGKMLLEFMAPGASMVAAGLGLIALGGVLKSVGGGGLAEQSQAGFPEGGGSAAAGGGLSSPPGGDFGHDVTAQKPMTSVQVVIQGNVLDRRQTGLEIADVINEVFGSNGVTFATAGA
jgi:hypothetical protein